MNAALLVLLITLGTEVESQPTAVANPGEYISGITAARVWEEDPGGRPELEGFHIAFTAFSKGRNSRHGNVGNWYVEWKESSRQEVLEGGLVLSYPYFQLSRLGLGPRYRLAVQERAEPPRRGTDVVLGVGFEVGVWLTERVQIAATADRNLGFEAGARSSYSVNLRVMFWKD